MRRGMLSLSREAGARQPQNAPTALPNSEKPPDQPVAQAEEPPTPQAAPPRRPLAPSGMLNAAMHSHSAAVQRARDRAATPDT